jgi:hypothetical protein
MTRSTVALATIALLSCAATAGAQGSGLSVGVAIPVGDVANTLGTGIVAALQIRTEPMLGPLPLRLDFGYVSFPGRNGTGATALETVAVGVAGDLGSIFYWAVGPGYYESSEHTQVQGHDLVEQRTYLGAQGALGVAIPVFRWQGYLEVGGVRMFSPHPTIAYAPMRFGIKL